MYNEYEIRPMPLSVAHVRRQVAAFLESNGLRLEETDYYVCVFKMGDDETILAGGGLCGDVIKCVAVNDRLREEGFSNRLVSHLISEADIRGHHAVKVFTKPENKVIFESMGFHLIGQAQKAILLENGDGLRRYCEYLAALISPQKADGRHGGIVMNANPFTLGHRYLIEQAAGQVDQLFVIIVGEDKSEFPYKERLAMVRHGTANIPNVTVCEGSSYAISSATFPTYFLKQLSDATDTQIALDLDLFIRHIAPALNIKTRFIGTEPTDRLTMRYNELIHEILPERGCKVEEIKRLNISRHAVSASVVRQLINKGSLTTAATLVPKTTLPYLIANMASCALQQELDTTPKPGLVDRHDSGAHDDMDYSKMVDSIQALRPFFVRLAELGNDKNLPETEDTITETIRRIGIEAEQAMLAATHGVNTHKGALFALGLTTVAAGQLLAEKGLVTVEDLGQRISRIAQDFPVAKDTHGAEVRRKYHIDGALDQARNGYSQLFDDWLPFYRRHRNEECQTHLTLLRIISTLDDTNIFFRKGAETAQLVKEQARQLLERFSTRGMRQLNESFVNSHISPGGSADMLALTIFIDVLTLNKELADNR